MKVCSNYAIPIKTRSIGFSASLISRDTSNSDVLPVLPENRAKALSLIKEEQRVLLGEFPYNVYGLDQPRRTNMAGWSFTVPSTYYAETKLPDELLTELSGIEPGIRFNSERVRSMKPYVGALDLAAFRQVPPCDTFCITTPTRKATFLLSGAFSDVFGNKLPLGQSLRNLQSRIAQFRV